MWLSANSGQASHRNATLKVLRCVDEKLLMLSPATSIVRSLSRQPGKGSNMRCRLTNPRERSVLALLSVPLLALCLAFLGVGPNRGARSGSRDRGRRYHLGQRASGASSRRESTMESRGVEVPSDDVLIRETLDRLILDSIQLQLANRYGVRIPDQQLDEAMTARATERVNAGAVPHCTRTVWSELCRGPRGAG